MEKQKKRLVLLDMHAILHRAYHALPDFSSKTGEPTGALYGLVTMLLKIIGELKPDYIVATYDLPKPTFRKLAFADYKGTRSKTDEALVGQIKRSRDIIDAFSIPIYEQEGFEADDILGSIVELVKDDEGIETIIASGDMDTLQLIDNSRVKVYTLKKGIKDTIIYDEKGVEERFGFGPELLPDYKALRGDPSDNIPGVRGVGEKTATTLITTFGTIESLYSELEKDREAFIKKSGVTERIANILQEEKEEAEFSKMLALIRRDADINFSLPTGLWYDEINVEKVESIFSDLDFRTLSERLSQAIKNSGGEGEIKSEEKKEVEDSFDPEELKRISIALWLIDSTITNPGYADILRYTETDSLGEASKVIFKRLKDDNLEKVFENIEEPLIPVIEKMEKRGVKLDLGALKKLSEKYHEKKSAIEQEIFSLAEMEFNINSPKQLGEVLFEKLNLSVSGISKTSTGARSTRESELEKLREKHPIVEKVFEYRELQKLLSTYIDVLPTLVDKSGRLHTTFLQAGTTTGRFASQNPNLQNIPIKTEQGRHIRRAFVSEKGYKLLALDYSQIELRVAAFLSGDEKLIEIFKGGGDAHTAVASQVFDVPESEVDGEMRRRAKIINFGIIYGMGVNALRRNLDTTRAEAQQFLNDYFVNFSGLRDYFESTKTFAKQKGYTETLFGRKRRFEDIHSRIPYIRAAAERMAVNAPIQGTQADIIKLAMVEIDKWLVSRGLQDKCFLVLQIHDELVFEVENACVEECAKEIAQIMENIVSLKETKGVPLIVSASTGDNWMEMKSI